MRKNIKKEIYVVSTVRNLDKENTPTVVTAIGLFEDFKVAEECVLNNSGDMNECGYYKHVVIEKLALNSIYFIGVKKRLQRWYEWQDVLNCYTKIKTPESAKNIVHWI